MKAQSRPLHDRDKRDARRDLADVAQLRVLGLINHAADSAEAGRVLKLLQLLRQAEELRLQLFKRAQIEKGPGKLTYPYGQDDSDLRRCTNEINVHLGRYRWTPKITAPQFYRLDDSPIWHEGKSTNRENWAVRWLLWQAYQGAGLIPAPILRFRQCEECHSWFYAKTDHAKFCPGNNCRKKFHSHNPEFKEKRAKYMQARRLSEKEETKQWWQKQHSRGYKRERQQ